MTTEWEDQMIRIGAMERPIIERAPTEREYDEDALEEREKLTEKIKENQLAEASDDELEDLLNDDEALEFYRKKRLEEIKQESKRARFGALFEINEPSYKEEVTNQPPEVFVVVFLHKPSIPHCQLMQQKLTNLAKKFADTKFVKIRSEEAIPNYPDKNLPTLLIYNKSDIVLQFVGLGPFGGESMTEDDVEWRLSLIGAVTNSNLTENPREKQFASGLKKGFLNGKGKKQRDESSSDED